MSQVLCGDHRISFLSFWVPNLVLAVKLRGFHLHYFHTTIKHVQWGQAFRNSRTSARHWLHPRRTAKGSKSNSTSSTEGSKQGYRNMKQGLPGQQHQLTKRTYISHLTVKAITVGRGENKRMMQPTKRFGIPAGILLVG